MDAIAVANYFIKKQKQVKSEHELTVLRLIKLVYIAYGFALSLLDRCIINPRFDKVEAWKLGPVIPSVYHTFKYNGIGEVKDEGGFLRTKEDGYSMFLYTPAVDKNDTELIAVLDLIWEKYLHISTAQIIDMLHSKGTPWAYCFRPGENKEILQEMTKLYFDQWIEDILHDGGREQE